MGRRRKFDESQAVAAAASLFRSRGYAATSVDDLVTATGVHRASLYATFGSKYGLFLRCLDGALAEPQPGEGLDLPLVALLELAPTDEAVRARLATAHHLTATGLGERLLARAGLPPHTAQEDS